MLRTKAQTTKYNSSIRLNGKFCQEMLIKKLRNIIIGGDFNTVLNRSIDRIATSKTKKRTYNGKDRLLRAPFCNLQLSQAILKK